MRGSISRYANTGTIRFPRSQWRGFFSSALIGQCARISGFWSGSRLTWHRSDHSVP